MATVRVTDKGTIILPKEILERRGLTAGTEFEVIEGGRDIVLKPVLQEQPPKKKLTVEEFIAGLPRIKEPVITDEMIDKAVSAEAKRMWDEENKR